jgi:hypothetical protein
MVCGLSPPNICGTWKTDCYITSSHTSNDASGSANICNPEIIEQIMYDVTQKNLLVTFKQRGSSAPELPLLGVWKPIYEHGKVHRWELNLVNNLDNGTYNIQVSKYKCDCHPCELFFTYTEAGFPFTYNSVDLSGNVNQLPTVAYGYFKKVF